MLCVEVSNYCVLSEEPNANFYRHQPWSTYAVQLTTLSPPAIIGDAFLWMLLIWGTADWARNDTIKAYCALGAWMLFSKFIKLITHFVRFPVDLLLWPVSVVFGWVHGIIKIHALLTLNEVRPDKTLAGTRTYEKQTTWGSRAGADASDSERMVPQNKLYAQQSYNHEKVYLEKVPLNHDFTNAQAIAA